MTKPRNPQDNAQAEADRLIRGMDAADGTLDRKIHKKSALKFISDETDSILDNYLDKGDVKDVGKVVDSLKVAAALQTWLEDPKTPNVVETKNAPRNAPRTIR